MQQFKSIKLSLVLLILLLLGLSIVGTGCGPLAREAGQEPAATQPQPQLKPAPQRIISLAPGHTEILFALGLGDKVVGVTEVCDYPAEALQKEKVGAFDKPNLERIISLNPDLVIANNLHERLAADLNRTKINVLLVSPRNVTEILASVATIGQATGTEAGATVLINQINQDIRAVMDKINSLAPSAKPVVYYEVWHEPVMTVGPGTVMDDLINRAGGINLGADAGQEYPEYSAEVLIQKNPQVMIHSYAHGTVEAVDPAAISKRKGWENLAFVKNSRIYQVDPNLATRPGPRIAEGLKEFARAIHPELFTEPVN